MLGDLKRVVIGSPIETARQTHERLSKKVALAVFSSDALSSVAYATEEILHILVLGGLAAITLSVPVAGAIAILLVVVSFSYRQTIKAYPHGGGSYIVAKDNLGVFPSLTAGAGLLVGYVLTVAVSLSAGVSAIVSALPYLDQYRVHMALVFVLLLTLVNLRGLRESGAIFSVPTYAFLLTIFALIIIGSYRYLTGTITPVASDEHLASLPSSAESISVVLLIQAFAAGCTALTGIEAISDGVPAFKKPEWVNARTTLTVMAGLLTFMFLGISFLAQQYLALPPEPGNPETVLSQIGRGVFGGRGVGYVVLQAATAMILVLAANTAYADFPRLSSIIARDGYLPRQFGNRGDRLVFSNGIVFLAVAAAGLIIAFGGLTNALIPLYAVGVFTSFTLSQLGMVRYQQRHKQPGWRFGATTSGIGATVTFFVLLIVAGTKFTSGAWVPLVVLPAIIALFLAIRRHYDKVSKALEITPEQVRPEAFNHTVVVLVGRVHKGVIKALNYAKSMRPNHLAAVYMASDDEEAEAMRRQWEAFGFDVPLEIVPSPYRDLVETVESYLDELDERWNNDTVTVLIPEFVVDKWYENVLHNQSALALKLALLDRRGTVVTSVPYHLSPAAASPSPDGAPPAGP